MTAVVRKARTLGVFGGSFNPPHLGHGDLVRALLERRLVDELWVVPVFEHPFGKELAPFPDRLEMCRLAFLPFAPWAKVSAIEGELGGPSYTVRTLERLHAARPEDELVLVVGADAMREAEHWHEHERVLSLARALVVPRVGESEVGEAALPAPRDVSSTEIRDHLRQGRPVTELLDPLVEAYIRAQGLYGPYAETEERR